MYAYGVLIRELLARSPPWPGSSPLQIAVAVAMHNRRPYEHLAAEFYERLPTHLGLERRYGVHPQQGAEQGNALHTNIRDKSLAYTHWPAITNFSDSIFGARPRILHYKHMRKQDETRGLDMGRSWCVLTDMHRFVSEAGSLAAGTTLEPCISVVAPPCMQGTAGLSAAEQHMAPPLPLPLPLPVHTPLKLLRLADACLDAEPARRPSAAEALKLLTLLIYQHVRMVES